jgi:hypothetical protein
MPQSASLADGQFRHLDNFNSQENPVKSPYTFVIVRPP